MALVTCHRTNSIGLKPSIKICERRLSVVDALSYRG